MKTETLIALQVFLAANSDRLSCVDGLLGAIADELKARGDELIRATYGGSPEPLREPSEIADGANRIASLFRRPIPPTSAAELVLSPTDRVLILSSDVMPFREQSMIRFQVGKSHVTITESNGPPRMRGHEWAPPLRALADHAESS